MLTLPHLEAKCCYWNEGSGLVVPLFEGFALGEDPLDRLSGSSPAFLQVGI